MSEQIIIAGLGRFGRSLAEELTKIGYDVLAVDRREEPVRELADSQVKVVRGEATSLGLWKDLPIEGANIGVVAFSSSVEASILTALLLRKIGVKKVFAKSQSDLHTEVLRAIGVDGVIEPPRESALRFAHTIGTRIEDYIAIAEDFGAAKIIATEPLAKMSIQRLYAERHIAVLLLRRGGKVEIMPRDDEVIKQGDLLLAAGKDSDLRQLPGVDNQKQEQ